MQLGAHLHPLHYQMEMGSVALHFGPQRWQKVQAMDEETPNKWPKKHAAVRDNPSLPTLFKSSPPATDGLKLPAVQIPIERYATVLAFIEDDDPTTRKGSSY